MPLMSTSFAGVASRVFIIGMRLWPPARKRTSSPAALAAIASSTEPRGDVVELGREHVGSPSSPAPSPTMVRPGERSLRPSRRPLRYIMRIEERMAMDIEQFYDADPRRRCQRRSNSVATGPTVPACGASSPGSPTPASSTPCGSPTRRSTWTRWVTTYEEQLPTEAVTVEVLGIVNGREAVDQLLARLGRRDGEARQPELGPAARRTTH